jgi:hypothetical protein
MSITSQLPQMRGRAMLRLKHAGGFLVGGEGFETCPPPLNDKAGYFAAVGEYGCHGTLNDNRAAGSE